MVLTAVPTRLSPTPKVKPKVYPSPEKTARKHNVIRNIDGTIVDYWHSGHYYQRQLTDHHEFIIIH